MSFPQCYSRAFLRLVFTRGKICWGRRGSVMFSCTSAWQVGTLVRLCSCWNHDWNPASWLSFIFLATKSFFFLIFTWEYICSLILEREEGRERERDIDVREKHWLVTSRTRPSQGLNLQPRYGSCLGIQPAAFLCTDWHSSRLSHLARAGYQFLVTSYSFRFYSLILLFMSSKIRLNQVIWRLRNHQIFCNLWWSWGFLSSLLIVGTVT